MKVLCYLLMISSLSASIYHTAEGCEEGLRRGAEPQFACVGAVVIDMPKAGTFSCNAFIIDSSHILMPSRGMQEARSAEFYFITPEGDHLTSELLLEHSVPIKACAGVYDVSIFCLAEPIRSFTSLPFFDADPKTVAWKNAYMVSVGRVACKGKLDDVREGRHVSICAPKPTRMTLSSGEEADILSCDFMEASHRLSMIPFPGEFGSPVLVSVGGALKVAGILVGATAKLPEVFDPTPEGVLSVFCQGYMQLEGVIVTGHSLASSVTEVTACMAGGVD